MTQPQLNWTRWHDWADFALRTFNILQDWPFYDFYDDIIVDEAQDLTPVELRVIRLLIAPTAPDTSETKSIMLLRETGQTPSSRGFYWAHAETQPKWPTPTFRQNHPNPRPSPESAA